MRYPYLKQPAFFPLRNPQNFGDGSDFYLGDGSFFSGILPGLVIFWVAMARNRRLKIKPDAAVYHCISRTINGEKLFGDTEKEVMRKQLRCVADFCGVTVVTFVL
ncbi:MAG: hypothetical protein LBT53_03125, partial [Puniceicoccales bacterium]|nr:hypothetical protein [Puniceicoccales bacterium]